MSVCHVVARNALKVSVETKLVDTSCVIGGEFKRWQPRVAAAFLLGGNTSWGRESKRMARDTLDSLTPDETAALIRDARGNGSRREAAFAELLRRASGVIRLNGNHYYSIDRDEVQSEAHTAMMVCVDTYDPTRGRFGTLFSIIFRGRLLTRLEYLTNEKRNKRRCSSMDATPEDCYGDCSFHDAIADQHDDIGRAIERAEFRELWPQVRERLTELERVALVLRVGYGWKYAAIARLLNEKHPTHRPVDGKSVDNGLRRAFGKLHAFKVAREAMAEHLVAC